MSSEESTPGGERVSRFREHTNTNSTIRAPPEEMWKDLGTELLLDKFSAEQASAPASRKRHPRHIMDRPTPVEPPTPEQRLAIAQRPIATPRTRKQSNAATVATAEGTFGRFSRLFTGIFTGVLGKRKPDSDEDALEFASPSRSNSLAPDQATLDHRKQAAEEAYHLAKAQGLLPAPKVFVRPGMPQRAWTSGDNAGASRSTTPSASHRTVPSTDTDSDMQTRTPLRPQLSMHNPLTGTRPRPPLTPRTPGSAARSPSKRDLKAQKKLTSRVSSLELKLASAKKELASVLGADACFPQVPPVPPVCTIIDETAGLRGGGGGGGEAEPSHRDGNSKPSSSPPQANAPMSDDAVPLSPSRTEPQSAALPRNLAKRRRTARKPVDDDPDDQPLAFLPLPPPAPATAASDVDTSEFEPEREEKENASHAEISNGKPQKKAKRVKKQKSRNKLRRKGSKGSIIDADEQEERVVVVKPGGAVPPVPRVPDGVHGTKALVLDDGYGGLGHEIF